MTEINHSVTVHVVFGILNLLACVVFLAIRLYQIRNCARPNLMSFTGLGCMVAAVLQCVALVNSQTEWYFGSVGSYCDMSMKLCSMFYTLLRVLLYGFVVLRLGVVLKSRLMNIGKLVVAVLGTFQVLVSLVFPHGSKVDDSSCAFDMDSTFLIVTASVDMMICFGATWLFLRPLKQALVSTEDEIIRQMFIKARLWSAISIITTVITVLTVTLVDGAAGVVGFDCSITSYCLLKMLTPVRADTKNENKVKMQVVKMTKLPDSGHSSGIRPSEVRLNG